MTLDNSWFSEDCNNTGSAFSLKIKNKVHDVQSAFQRIEVYDTTDFGYLMVIDGFTMVSTRDNFIYHEMMTHPALFSHPDPKKVVIIGGGDCGTLREVLKHDSVQQVWQIDIDEQVTLAAEKFFPELCESNNDPRATLLFEDGIKWVADAEANSIDLIIIDSTDPIGPAEELFSQSFYKNCLRILNQDGLIVQQSESPLLHMDLIKNMYVEMKQGGLQNPTTLNFPQCIYPSGWWSATMARKSNTPIVFREEDAVNKQFSTRYYNAQVHQAALVMPEFFRAEFAEIE